MKNEELSVIVEKLKNLHENCKQPTNPDLDFSTSWGFEYGSAFLDFLLSSGSKEKAQNFYNALRFSNYWYPMDFEPSNYIINNTAPPTITSQMMYNQEEFLGFSPFVLEFLTNSLYDHDTEFVSYEKQREITSDLLELSAKRWSNEWSHILSSLKQELVYDGLSLDKDTYLVRSPSFPGEDLIKEGDEIYLINSNYQPEFDGNKMQLDLTLISVDVKDFSKSTIDTDFDSKFTHHFNLTFKSFDDVYKEWKSDLPVSDPQSIASRLNNETISNTVNYRFWKTLLDSMSQDQLIEIESKINKFEVNVIFSNIVNDLEVKENIQETKIKSNKKIK